MTRETETERAEVRKETPAERRVDPPPEKQPGNEDPEHRFRDWALI